MVAGVAVYNVEVMNFLEMMLSSIGSVDACHARVESAAQDGSQASLFEAFAVSPLPAVLEVRLVARLVVGSIQIVDATFQTSVHDCKVLIRQRHIDDNVRAMLLEQLHQLRHAVGIHRVGDDVRCANSLSHSVALAFCARSNHNFVENVGVLGTLVSHNSANTTATDNQYFTHSFV